MKTIRFQSDSVAYPNFKELHQDLIVQTKFHESSTDNIGTWLEQIVIIFQDRYGISPIVAINRNFFLNFLVIGKDGYSGCLRRRNATG